MQDYCHANPMNADLKWRQAGFYGQAVRWGWRARDLALVKTSSSGLQLLRDTHTKRLFMHNPRIEHGFVQYCAETDAAYFE